MAIQPFKGIKILDMSNHIAGSFCTKIFADHGADVIKIEKPGRGCLTRHMPPFVGDTPDINRSIYFLYANTNKRGVTLNLKSETGKHIFAKLVLDVDIVVESFAPQTSSALGLDYEHIEKINPKVIVTSITNFGKTGPYRDFKASELIEYAMGGAMYSTGLPHKEPLSKGQNALLFEVGMQTCYLTLGAYMGARKDGIGDCIDISIMEAQLAGCDRMTSYLLSYQYTGGDITRRVPPTEGLFSTVPPILPCKDGYITSAIGPKNFNKFLTMLGRPDLIDDPSWDANNMEITPEVLEIYHECLKKKTKVEWAELFQKEKMICTPLNTPADVCNDEQWTSRNFFVDVDHPSTGVIKYPRGPVRTDADWWRIKNPAPLLGQHNGEVYGELGYTTDDMVALEAQGVI